MYKDTLEHKIVNFESYGDYSSKNYGVNALMFTDVNNIENSPRILTYGGYRTYVLYHIQQVQHIVYRYETYTLYSGTRCSGIDTL